MEKLNKTKILHIAVIILGIIYVFLSIFHENIWFDETYSVGMARHTFTEIWKIGGNDVHPVLYYWLLRIVTLITGGSILSYRIFTALGVAILGILGYTHIRKDFGEKTGIIFSFLSYFLPAMPVFTNQIRMYTWAILSVTILSIYGYRLIKESTNKNWIIFELASVFSIFIHYYGLMVAGIINVCLLVYLIKNKRKQDIIKILIGGVIQAILYIPWLVYFAKQLNNISHGFWIGFDFPNTLIEILSFQFIGNLNYYVGFVASILVYSYCGICIYRARKEKQELLPAKLSISIYISVILAAIIMTAILGTSIVYYRYLFVITGLYIFTLSFALSKEKNKYIIIAICSVILILSSISTYKLFKENYSPRNQKPIEYLKENVQEGDMFVYNFAGNGFVMTAYFDTNTHIFYNPENWGVEEAYKAFGDNFKISVDESFMEECKGRIWIIDNQNKDVYNKLFNNEEYTLISEKFFETDYENYDYNMILVEK